MHAVRQTNKRCTMSATIIRIRACSSGWRPCGSRVRVYRITRSHNCTPSLPIPCDPLKLYPTGGVEALKHLNFHGPQSLLRAHRDTIEAQGRAIRRRRSTKLSRWHCQVVGDEIVPKRPQALSGEPFHRPDAAAARSSRAFGPTLAAVVPLCAVRRRGQPRPSGAKRVGQGTRRGQHALGLARRLAPLPATRTLPRGPLRVLTAVGEGATRAGGASGQALALRRAVALALRRADDRGTYRKPVRSGRKTCCAAGLWRRLWPRRARPGAAGATARPQAWRAPCIVKHPAATGPLGALGGRVDVAAVASACPTQPPWAAGVMGASSPRSHRRACPARRLRGTREESQPPGLLIAPGQRGFVSRAVAAGGLRSGSLSAYVSGA